MVNALDNDTKGLFFTFGIPNVVLFDLFRSHIQPVLEEPPDFLLIDLNLLINAKSDLSLIIEITLSLTMIL